MANALFGEKVYLDINSSLYSPGVLALDDWAYLDTNSLGWMNDTWFVNGLSGWSDRMFVDSFGREISESNGVAISHKMIGVGNSKHGWVEHESFGLIYLAPDIYSIYETEYWVNRLNVRTLYFSNPNYEESNQLLNLGVGGTNYDFLYTRTAGTGVWVWLGQSNGFSGQYDPVLNWVFFTKRWSVFSGGQNIRSQSVSQFNNTGISGHVSGEGVMGIASFWIQGTVNVGASYITGTGTSFLSHFDQSRVVYISHDNGGVSMHKIVSIESDTQIQIEGDVGDEVWENRKIGRDGLIYYIKGSDGFYVKTDYMASWSKIDENYRSSVELTPLSEYNFL